MQKSILICIIYNRVHLQHSSSNKNKKQRKGVNDSIDLVYLKKNTNTFFFFFEKWHCKITSKFLSTTVKKKIFRKIPKNAIFDEKKKYIFIYSGKKAWKNKNSIGFILLCWFFSRHYRIERYDNQCLVRFYDSSILFSFL